MATDPQNSPFIKNLASSDKEIRDSALQSLRTYLSSQSSIPDLDLLKLWKGLFYCMWMQDKPALQQRLARDLASIPSVLQDSVVLPFLESFWKTMTREWTQIDNLRMDKYLFLVRHYLHASFQYLASKEWEGGLVDKHNELLMETPLHPKDPKVPNGLRFHVLDIYLDELEKVAGEEVEGVPTEKMLAPVERLAKEGMVKAVRKAAKEVLEDERVKAWRGGEVQKDEDEDEWGGIEE